MSFNPRYFDEKSISLAPSETLATRDKSASGGAIKNQNNSNKELAEDLHKPIFTKFDNRKVQSPFIDKIWGADLADMQLINKFNKGIRFLLCVIDIFSKYVWDIPLKDEKGIKTQGFPKKILQKTKQNMSR